MLSRQLPKVERKEMTTLSAQQASRLLEAIRHNRIHWPVLLALATGARRGEVLALRWRHVDLDRGFVQIVQSLEETKSGLRFKRPKNERGRAVVLPGFAISDSGATSTNKPKSCWRSAFVRTRTHFCAGELIHSIPTADSTKLPR